MGVASLLLPHAQRAAVVALDSQGFLHLFLTPLSTGVVVWDPNMDVPVTGQQGMPGAALSATRAAATSQQPERAVNSIGSGERYRSNAPLLSPLQPVPPCMWPCLLRVQCSPKPYTLYIHKSVASSASATLFSNVPAARYCLPPMCKGVSRATADC